MGGGVTDIEPDQSQFGMVFCDVPEGSSTTTYSELFLKPGTIFRLTEDGAGDLTARKWSGYTQRESSPCVVSYRASDDRWTMSSSDGMTNFVVATTSGHTNPWDVPRWEFMPNLDLGVFYGQLFQPIDLSKPVFRITNAGETELIGDYVEVPSSVYSQYVSSAFQPTRTITHIYTNVDYGDYVVEGNSIEPYVYCTRRTVPDDRTQPLYTGAVATDSHDPLSVQSWVVEGGSNPSPTLEVIS